MPAEYITDNIIIGAGEVPAMRTPKGILYMLPGYGSTYDKSEAEQYAARLDKLVSTNLHKYKRRLFQR